MPAVLRNDDPEVVKKACWALTNLSRNQEAQKELVRSGTFKSLIGLLGDPSNDIRGAVLQPLCNLVLDAENQSQFERSGGVAPVVKLLHAGDEKTKELAVTLISFVTTNHDSVRNALVKEGVLPLLGDLVEGSGTEKMQEYAINSLVNLSLSDDAEQAIADQGVLSPVVGLLSSSSPKLQQQAAMLLSNMLTNRNVREKIRYVGWVDPVLDIAKTNEVEALQQIIRVIINITFDAHCRSLLVKRGAEKVVGDITKRVDEPTVQNLCTTALKNLSVPVASDVQHDVEEALRTGEAVNRIAPPEARRKDKTNDLSGLDDLLGDLATGKRDHEVKSVGQKTVDNTLSRPAPSSESSVTTLAPPPSMKPKAVPSSGADPLDDILNGLGGGSSSSSTPAKKAPPPSKHQAALDDIDSLLADTPSSKPSSSQNQQAHSDLDDILNSIPRKSAAKPTTSNTSDIDDILAGLDGPSSSSSKNSGMDDIDDLLNGIDEPSSSTQQSHDDIDDLLAGIDEPSSGGGGGDDIDDLLAEFGSGPSDNSSAITDIDDLLSDITG